MVTIAYLLTIVSFPIRAIGWLLGEFPRSVVGYRRAKAVLDATGDMAYGDDELPGAHDAARCSQVEDLHYSYDADDAAAARRRLRGPARAAPSRWSVPRRPARAR